MKIIKWFYLNVIKLPTEFLIKMYNEKGLLYVIYFIFLGLMISMLKRVYNDVKSLGLFFGLLAAIISLTLFFGPTILGGIIYYLTGSFWWLGIATSYLTWIILPTGSVFLYTLISVIVIEIMKFIRNSIGLGPTNE